MVMKISDVLHKEAIVCNLTAYDKQGVISELGEKLARLSGIAPNEITRVLMEREDMGSTGIGSGIGIPHGKVEGLSEPLMAFGLSSEGVDFESLDGKPAHIFFVLLTPEHAPSIHLKLLAGIAKILRNEPFRHRLMAASCADEILNILRDEEETF